MLARLTAFVVWSLVAGTATFWGLRVMARPQPAPPFTVGAGDATVARGDLSRLLGKTPEPAAQAAAPSSPALASRFRLLGVMAGRPTPNAAVSAPGYAVIAVDGKPARAFPVGASLDGSLVLQAVSLRSASIGPAQGTTALMLEVPPLATAATGTLPPPAGFVPPAPPGVMPPSGAQPIVPPPPAMVPGLPPRPVLPGRAPQPLPPGAVTNVDPNPAQPVDDGSLVDAPVPGTTAPRTGVLVQ